MAAVLGVMVWLMVLRGLFSHFKTSSLKKKGRDGYQVAGAKNQGLATALSASLPVSGAQKSRAEPYGSSPAGWQP